MALSYIPADEPFLMALAKGLLAKVQTTPEMLASMTILLPTRRACRTLCDLFLDINDGQPILLPRLRAVSDTDADELIMMMPEKAFEQAGILPEISSFERLSVLSNMIRSADPTLNSDGSLVLSEALCAFLDRVQIEEIDMGNLDHLVAEEFADHWKLTLDFLKIIRDAWPAYLTSCHRMDPVMRQVRLIRLLADEWSGAPPSGPILMAGITGGIKAVSYLMKIVASLPQGDVILAGYDPNFNPDILTSDDNQHPYSELNQIILDFGRKWEDVRLWPFYNPVKQNENILDKNARKARSWLWREAMIPARVACWGDLSGSLSPDDKQNIQNALSGMKIVEASHVQEEAEIIAADVRLALEHPEKTIAIITPDRHLSMAISSACRSYGVDVNDSAGDVLTYTAHARFLRMILDVMTSDVDFLLISDLLSHPFLETDITPAQKAHLDVHAWRGITRDISKLKEYLVSCKIPQDVAEKVLFVLSILSKEKTDEKQSIFACVTRHLTLAESLCRKNINETALIWEDEAGKSLQELFDMLLNPDILIPDMTLKDYAGFLRILMEGGRVNKIGVGHPRVALLGVYEARLTRADHVILAGFNEGLWPKDQDSDPWMSRAMRKDFGLPPIDVNIGRMALDVLQFSCASSFTLTRSVQMDGEVMIESRWLQRLRAVLKGIGIEEKKLFDPSLRNLVIMRHKKNLVYKPVSCPVPCPSISLRPREMSVTQIEKLMNNPYSFYAAHILGLSPLDLYNMDPDARVYGILFHSILCEFMTNMRDVVNQNHISDLIKDIDNRMDHLFFNAKTRSIMRPRIMASLSQYLKDEIQRAKDGCQPLFFEKKWKIDLETPAGPFRISARIDRIDVLPDHTYQIIDYKTGQVPSKKKVVDGLAPQLPLEMMLFENGCLFDKDIDAENIGKNVSSLLFWHISPKSNKSLLIQDGQKKDYIKNIRALTKQGAKDLFAAFMNEKMPYLAFSGSDNHISTLIYSPLSRLEEWRGGDKSIKEKI